jgi:hypothetical protein
MQKTVVRTTAPSALLTSIQNRPLPAIAWQIRHTRKATSMAAGKPLHHGQRSARRIESAVRPATMMKGASSSARIPNTMAKTTASTRRLTVVSRKPSYVPEKVITIPMTTPAPMPAASRMATVQAAAVTLLTTTMPAASRLRVQR